MRLDGKVSKSVDVVSVVPQGNVLEPLLFISCTSELFHNLENHTMSYADDTTIYAVIPRPPSRFQVMESLNHDFVSIYSCFSKWYMRLSPSKPKSTVVSRSRIYAPGYGDITLGGAELQKVKKKCAYSWGHNTLGWTKHMH